MELWKGGSMKQSKDFVRLSLDITPEEHIHLKMRATQKGISMREYILEALAYKEETEEKFKDMDDKTFRKGLKKLHKEHSQLAKNLAKR